MSASRIFLFLVIAVFCAGCASTSAETSRLALGFRQVPRGEGKPPTPKLDVDHADTGAVCELQCYETGPFQHGDAVKNADGSVVFSYSSGNMTATTTFRTVGDDRVDVRVIVKGPVDELKKVSYLGPCLQFQRSKEFTRSGPLREFAGRCFIYTMRGPVTLIDTARGKSTNFPADAPENNPPLVQWYLPVERMHPGSIWGSVGAAGDRPIVGVIACTSRDGRWLAAYASRHNLNIGQLFMPCIHVLPDVKMALDEKAGTISYREIIYVMPNDAKRLFEAFGEDFPPEGAMFAAVAKGEALELKPVGDDVPAIALRLDVGAGGWQSTWWGTFIRGGEDSRAWASPHGDVLELCIAFKPGKTPANITALATIAGGEDWASVVPPGGTGSKVLRSKDGRWTAALFWEREGVPAESEPDGSIAVRGKLIVAKTDTLDLARRMRWAQMDWEHAAPYRAPLDDAR